jgi:hypothetical protein
VKAGWIITDKALENDDWSPPQIDARNHDLIKRAKAAMKTKLA